MSDMFISLTFAGASIGACYALIALGFVVIYQSSQIFNFAHGELLALGAFSMTTFAGIGLPWPLALIAAMVLTGLVAAGVERAVIRPMIGRPVFVTIILTLIVAALLRSVVLMFWSEDRGMPTPWAMDANVEIFGSSVLYNQLGALVVGFIALGFFFYLLRFTKFGIAMRATNTDQETALALGIPVGRVFGSTWFLAGMYACLAGVFMAMYPRGLTTNIGYDAFRAFPAVIVGGLTSPVGAVVAGILLGLMEVYAQAYLQPELGEFGKNIHEVFPYVVMIIFLMVRPYGLFGKKEVERV